MSTLGNRSAGNSADTCMVHFPTIGRSSMSVPFSIKHIEYNNYCMLFVNIGLAAPACDVRKPRPLCSPVDAYLLLVYFGDNHTFGVIPAPDSEDKAGVRQLDIVAPFDFPTCASDLGDEWLEVPLQFAPCGIAWRFGPQALLMPFCKCFLYDPCRESVRGHCYGKLQMKKPIVAEGAVVHFFAFLFGEHYAL